MTEASQDSAPKKTPPLAPMWLGSSLATLQRKLNAPEWVTYRRLLEWVQWVSGLTRPSRIHWCDGSQEEYDRLCEQMVASGTLRRLDPEKRPNSWLALSDPDDVARVEDRTFICTE